MAAPEILTNENVFKREALRYTLYDPEDPISMVGTVFSEDFGNLTNLDRVSSNNVLDALYPGEYASNYLGRAHRNYQDLTYKSLLETYERCYHFDNSLILLYGDLSWRDFLEFIDSEYLSKVERNGTDLSAYVDGPTEPGHVEVTVPAPAYEGDAAENASRIDYAISLADAGWEDIIYWDLLTTLLTNMNSAFYSQTEAAGITNQIATYIYPYQAKPHVGFVLYNAEPEQAHTFQQAVIKTLEQVAEEGVDPEILRTELKQIQTSNYLLRDSDNVGVDVFSSIVNYWVHTGEVNYYELFEQALDTIAQDADQTVFRRLAAEALAAERTALVTTVPEPGLAEEIIAEQEAYLADMKAAMSDEEIQQLIDDTLAFDTWNEQTVSNSDFVIGPEVLPAVTADTEYTVVQGDGIDYYLAPAEVENVGSFYLGFDASDFSNEDLLDLSLYKLLVGKLDTEQHTEEELQNLKSEYLYSWTTVNRYPSDGAEEVYPIQEICWTCLTEDYAQSLALLMEMYGSTDFSDTARIQEVLARYTDSYDLSRMGSSYFLSYALTIALGYIINTNSYWFQANKQEVYYYLKDVQQKLAEDAGFGAELAQRMDAVADKLLQKGRVFLLAAAPEEDLEQIRQVTEQAVRTLPAREAGDIQMELDLGSRDVAIAVESSNQYTARAATFYQQEGFLGRYIPFLMAAEDQYIIPKLRFQMGAYSAGVTVNLYNEYFCAYTSRDPNAAATLEVFDGIEEFIANMELTQEDLDSYILTSYSYFGQAMGVLQEPLQAMENVILGHDMQAIADMANDMKCATLADQQAAAKAIGALFDSGSTVTLGNEATLEAEKDAYDQFISYRSGGQTADPGDSGAAEQHWYSDAMGYVWDNGLMDSQSVPSDPVTRAALVTALWRMAGQPTVDFAVSFTDVAEDATYAEAVRWAAGVKILEDSTGSFGPEDSVTREEAIVLLYRYAQARGYDVSVGEDTNILSYADIADVSEGAIAAFQWACGAGVIQGDSGGALLDPLSDCSNAEIASMLMRLAA